MKYAIINIDEKGKRWVNLNEWYPKCFAGAEGCTRARLFPSVEKAQAFKREWDMPAPRYVVEEWVQP